MKVGRLPVLFLPRAGADHRPARQRERWLSHAHHAIRASRAERVHVRHLLRRIDPQAIGDDDDELRGERLARVAGRARFDVWRLVVDERAERIGSELRRGEVPTG